MSEEECFGPGTTSSSIFPARLISKTTAKTGDTLTLPVAVAIGVADGTKHVYIGSVNVVYKAVQGKSGKAAKAK